MYGIYNGSPCKSHTDRSLIFYDLLHNSLSFFILIHFLFSKIHVYIYIYPNFQEMKETMDEFESNWSQGTFPGWPVSNIINLIK